MTVRRGGATKSRRHEAILDLVRSRPVHTQEEIVAALADRRLDATQATVSRDLRELGLLRVSDRDGIHYVAGTPVGDEPPSIGARLGAVMRDHARSVEVVGQLGVLRTRPSTAPLVAAAIDAARLDEVAGTVAGDDTVLVVARGAEAATRLARRFRTYIGDA